MRTKIATGPDYEALYESAERQMGFFTAPQAVAAGYSRPNHTYHVKTKDWQRFERGIYRLSHFPAMGRQDVMLAYLWCSNLTGKPLGVVSHDTALEVHNLSTWISSKYHLTVPKGFRKRGETGFQSQFHYADLSAQDVENIDGFRVTKPLRTIVDLLDWGRLDLRHLKDALSQAFDRYQILPEDIRQLTLSHEQSQSLRLLLGMFNDVEIQSLL
jgi:predicted transcriptional regulator of viral defense system